jgi:hypothetical protein
MRVAEAGGLRWEWSKRSARRSIACYALTAAYVAEITQSSRAGAQFR